MTASWVLFNLVLLLLILLDLNIAKGRTLSFKAAISFSAAWVGLAALFAVLLGTTQGKLAAMQFTAGYLIELSLSVDNVFVFLLVFQYFQIKEELQPKILFWGVIGALIMRLVFILVGLSLVQAFSSVFYFFGAFLIAASLFMLFSKEKKIDPKKNYLLSFAKKCVPFTDQDAVTMFVRKEGEGKLYATSLFAALLTIEALDLVFALDSIPAIFGVTCDPFIVYTSNALAIVGLRSFYFTIQHLVGYFAHLHYGVCAVLLFIGLKMVTKELFEINTLQSLVVIILILTCSIISSIYSKAKGQSS